jgi:hypothetical protein
MTLNVNDTEMSLVNVNGTRMEVVNVNGTEVYRAQNGNVTLAYAGGVSGSFSPGAEDVNRHFVVIGTLFLGTGSRPVTAPLINGVATTQIVANVVGGSDFGSCGIFSIKAPTGTSSFTVSAPAFETATVYRVTGINSMASALSTGTSSGNATSSAKGCFFGASVGNFSLPPSPTPNSSGLAASYVYGCAAASNVTTGPTQSVGLNGSQANCFAIFAYDIF